MDINCLPPQRGYTRLHPVAFSATVTWQLDDFISLIFHLPRSPHNLKLKPRNIFIQDACPSQVHEIWSSYITNSPPCSATLVLFLLLSLLLFFFFSSSYSDKEEEKNIVYYSRSAINMLTRSVLCDPFSCPVMARGLPV